MYNDDINIEEFHNSSVDSENSVNESMYMSFQQNHGNNPSFQFRKDKIKSIGHPESPTAINQKDKLSQSI